MKKKIIYVITKANWGGAQRYVFDLASSLPKDEFDVAVAFGQRGRLAEELAKAGITTHEIKSLQRDVSFSADIASIAELRRLFKREEPNIVHLNSSKAGGVGALAARLAGVPRIIFTAHGWPFWEDRGAFAKALIWFFSWLTALLSHTVIVISEYDLRVARAMPFIGHKCVRIYNGLRTEALGPGDSIRRAFPSGAHITGTIGELNRNKNQRALVEEAARDPQMYVAIVGEGELRSELESLIHAYHLEDRVKLFGFRPAADVLRGFDTFALPSIKEGLPYVLLEARAAGLPIKATRVGGVGEILDAQSMDQFEFKKMLEKTISQYRIPHSTQP